MEVIEPFNASFTVSWGKLRWLFTRRHLIDNKDVILVAANHASY